MIKTNSTKEKQKTINQMIQMFNNWNDLAMYRWWYKYHNIIYDDNSTLKNIILLLILILKTRNNEQCEHIYVDAANSWNILTFNYSTYTKIYTITGPKYLYTHCFLSANKIIAILLNAH